MIMIMRFNNAIQFDPTRVNMMEMKSPFICIHEVHTY